MKNWTKFDGVINSKEDYDDLKSLISYHDKLYYDNDAPELTDSEYDHLYFLLKKTEESHPEFVTSDSLSTTQTIAGGLSDKLSKIKHTHKMLSLAKGNSLEDVQSFLDKWTFDDKDDLFYTDGFLVQHKEDGLTTVLYFNEPTVNNGNFTAATRGNGELGEDVTENYIHVLGQELINNILSELDGKKLIVRGEAIIDDADFEKVNVDGTYMNSRNLASGSIRTKDTTIAAKRGVHVLLYNIENADDFGFDTELEQLSYITRLFGKNNTDYPLDKTGHNYNVEFNLHHQAQAVSEFLLSKSDVISLIDNYSAEERNNIGHTIDGLVIKPNNISRRAEIGFTGHHPKNQLAYKFASEDAKTKLTDVVWQTGPKGIISPVGIIEPVELMGAKISRASLANMANIKKRDIKIGDTILIRRSNDVIPQIVKSFADERDGSETTVLPPKNAVLVNANYIANTVTKEQLVNQWRVAVSKDAFAIDGLSTKAIEKLAENNLIDLENFATIFNLDKTKFLEIDGFGDKKWNSLQSELEKSKNVGLSHVLVSLNILGLGKTLSKQLADYEPDFNKLIKLYQENAISNWVDDFVNNTKGVGDSARAILMDKLFSDNVINKLIDLQKLGVKLVDNSQHNESNSQINGKKIVVTGSTEHPRRELKELIESNGAKLAGSVSKNTDYLVTNDQSSTSSKLTKAKELDVPIIDEDALWSLLSLTQNH